MTTKAEKVVLSSLETLSHSVGQGLEELALIQARQESQIQTVVFRTDESPTDVNGGDGWTASSARSWLADHDFRSDKIDETDNTIRFRQIDPERCIRGSFSVLTENMPRGVRLTACRVAS